MTLTASTFAAELHRHRKRLKITQKEAAALCGVSLRTWWEWEHGEGTLGVAMEGALARLEAVVAKSATTHHTR